MGTTTRACLFGGAIFAAGIVAAPAQAQTFNWVAGGASVLASDYGSNSPFTNATTSPAGWAPITAAIPGLAYAHNYGNLTAAGAFASSGNALANAGTFAYFEVTADTTVEVWWDFSGFSNDPAGGGYSRVELVSLTAGGLARYHTDDPGWLVSGSEQFDIFAGDLLIWITSIQTYSGSDGASFGTLRIVPAPASGAVLAIGGLVATRRRRR